MKGIVFTEFTGFVERRFGLAMVDRLILETAPCSGGVYTSVGTYDAGELIAMAARLSEITDVSVSALVKEFGGHLFQHFVISHASTMGNVSSSEALLRSVDDHIHVEVRKLFPDAELPKIEFVKLSDSTCNVLYQSSRPFADLAEGLIDASIRHFGEAIQLSRQDLEPFDGTHAVFHLVRC